MALRHWDRENSELRSRKEDRTRVAVEMVEIVADRTVALAHLGVGVDLAVVGVAREVVSAVKGVDSGVDPIQGVGAIAIMEMVEIQADSGLEETSVARDRAIREVQEMAAHSVAHEMADEAVDSVVEVAAEILVAGMTDSAVVHRAVDSKQHRETLH